MKKVVLVLSLSLVSIMFSSNLLADVRAGIGSRVATFIALGGGNGAISSINTLTVPIKFGDKILVEPELIYVDSEETDSEGDTSESTSKEITVGIFRLSNSSSPTKPYFGFRVGISKLESKSTFGDFSIKKDETAKMISPTIGVEIEVIENFSIAGKLGFTYTKSDESETKNTDSRLMVRFLF